MLALEARCLGLLGERTDMLREDLLAQIAGLPAGIDMGIRLRGELLGIETVDQLPAEGETFGMLTCTSAHVARLGV